MLEQRGGALRQCVLNRATAGGPNGKPKKLINGVENKTPTKYINFSLSDHLC